LWNIGAVVTAIETIGTVEAQHRLRLEDPLPLAGPSRVRVIILASEAGDSEEKAWAKPASTSPAFEFLKDAAEGVYTQADGKPFRARVA